MIFASILGEFHGDLIAKGFEQRQEQRRLYRTCRETTQAAHLVRFHAVGDFRPCLSIRERKLKERLFEVYSSLLLSGTRKER